MNSDELVKALESGENALEAVNRLADNKPKRISTNSIPTTISTSSPIKKEWPDWAKRLRKRKRDGEIGVGDTFHRIASKLGGEQIKSTAAFLGIPCGCTARRQRWNKEYPYEPTNQNLPGDQEIGN